MNKPSPLPEHRPGSRPLAAGDSKTAFVLAGGGSLGAVQVGMLKALVDNDVLPDLLVGTSVGAINAAFIAGNPSKTGVRRLEAVWRKLHRRNIFPFSASKGVLGFLGVRDHIITPASLTDLVMNELDYEYFEDARIPCVLVATDILEGSEVELSRGRLLPALLASAAIPAVFPPVAVEGRLLMDGAIANNTPMSTAVKFGARRVIVLPTGFSCALAQAPRGAVAMAMHAINLMIMRQMLRDYEHYSRQVELVIVPPLCPLNVNPFDFSRTDELINRAEASTREWLAEGGLASHGLPHQLELHDHLDEYGIHITDTEIPVPDTAHHSIWRRPQHLVGNGRTAH